MEESSVRLDWYLKPTPPCKDEGLICPYRKTISRYSAVIDALVSAPPRERRTAVDIPSILVGVARRAYIPT